MLSGAAVSWVAMLAFDAAGSFPPVVPWSVAVVLVVLAVAVLSYSRVLPKRLEQRKVSSQEALYAISIGKAMLMTGAVFAGAHTVYVMRFITRLEAPLPSARVVQGVAVMVAALLLALSGALLERACVIKDNDDDESGSGSAAGLA